MGGGVRGEPVNSRMLSPSRSGIPPPTSPITPTTAILPTAAARLMNNKSEASRSIGFTPLLISTWGWCTGCVSAKQKGGGVSVGVVYRGCIGGGGARRGC